MSVIHNLKIPIVVRKKLINDKFVFLGFVPGITKKDIINQDFFACKQLLIKHINDLLLSNPSLTQNVFFPSKQELLNDFDDIFYIAFLKF